MTDSLDPQPWMTAPATRAVIEALELKGGRGCARFVGGCVRNAVLDREIDDIDIATTLTPGEATAALEARSLKVAPTGVEHGTVTAVSDHQPFEITTLRRDVSTDGRRGHPGLGIERVGHGAIVEGEREAAGTIAAQAAGAP